MYNFIFLCLWKQVRYLFSSSIIESPIYTGVTILTYFSNHESYFSINPQVSLYYLPQIFIFPRFSIISHRILDLGLEQAQLMTEIIISPNHKYCYLIWSFSLYFLADIVKVVTAILFTSFYKLVEVTLGPGSETL